MTDNATGLMWEKKTGTLAVPNPSDPHDVNNMYTWSAASPYTDPTGTLFTNFLGPISETSCFAGYCDWRIPKQGELRTLLTAEYPNCSGLCIDSALGLTAPGAYWSSSTLPGNTTEVGQIIFEFGQVQNMWKGSGGFARAVRGGR